MNMTIVITLCMGVVYHMDEFHLEVMGGIRTHKHIIFLYNIKQQWLHPFDTPDGKPMQHPPLFIVYTLTFGQ